MFDEVSYCRNALSVCDVDAVEYWERRLMLALLKDMGFMFICEVI